MQTAHEQDRIHRHAFCYCDLDLDPVTSIYQRDPDIPKMYRYLRNKN